MNAGAEMAVDENALWIEYYDEPDSYCNCCAIHSIEEIDFGQCSCCGKPLVPGEYT